MQPYNCSLTPLLAAARSPLEAALESTLGRAFGLFFHAGQTSLKRWEKAVLDSRPSRLAVVVTISYRVARQRQRGVKRLAALVQLPRREIEPATSGIAGPVCSTVAPRQYPMLVHFRKEQKTLPVSLPLSRYLPGKRLTPTAPIGNWQRARM